MENRYEVLYMQKYHEMWQHISFQLKQLELYRHHKKRSQVIFGAETQLQCMKHCEARTKKNIFLGATSYLARGYKKLMQKRTIVALLHVYLRDG